MKKKFVSDVEFLRKEIGAGKGTQTCGKVAFSCTPRDVWEWSVVSCGKLFKVDGIESAKTLRHVFEQK